MVVAWLLPAVLLLAGSPAKTYTYVGDLGPRHALVAWGTTAGKNTIGRSSPGIGAELHVAGRVVLSPSQNYVIVRDLEPDREYPYEVWLRGSAVAKGKFRTWAETADRFCFLVIGDWGSGDERQRKVAGAMWEEFQRLSAAGCPARFVLSTGDNIYAPKGLLQKIARSGKSDSDWETKFFAPYEPLIQQIPFYAVLGNHDGNESEARGDLPAYLDNFFFPDDKPARWFHFRYGGLAEFFGLDSTRNTESGPTRPAFEEHGPQHQWFELVVHASTAHWKIVWMHHPLFTAGPNHEDSRPQLRHFMDNFVEQGVSLVLTGHEHNLQFSEVSPATGGVQYIVSGAGGELRDGDVKSDMKKEHVAAWAPQSHFLSVEVTRAQILVNPVSYESFTVVNAAGNPVSMPVKVLPRIR